MPALLAAGKAGKVFPYVSPLAAYDGGNGFYVSSTADGSGDGGFFRPWTLAQAVAQASAGMTLWLRGGTYDATGTICFDLSACTGTSGSRITWRSYPGERAHWRCIDADPGAAGGTVLKTGPYNTFRDMEFSILWGSTSRWYDAAHESSSRRGSVLMNGSTVRFVNCYVHDCCSGPQSFDAAPGSLTYGNVLLNNGYLQANGHHGHGVYQQNGNYPTRKTVQHNLSMYSFGSGLKTAGDQARIDGMDVLGNVICSAGSHGELAQPTDPGDLHPGWEFYSNIGTRDVKFNDNVEWLPYYGSTSPASGGSHLVGNYFAGGGTYQDLEVLRNWGFSGARAVAINYQMSQLTSQNNVWWVSTSAPSGVSFLMHQNLDPTTMAYGGNEYHGGNPAAPLFFNPSGGSMNTFAAWKAATSQDSTSSYSASLPSDTHKVLANTYEAGRANVAVMNQNAHAATVVVSMAGVLVVGDPYYVWNAANPEFGIIASGTYDGVGIPFPMTEAACGSVAKPQGFAAVDYTPVSTLPDFGAFVVRKSPYAPGYGPPAAHAIAA